MEGIIADLQDCVSFDDSGVRPVRASSTRWISHKVEALKRVLSKFGAYTSHLAVLSEDRTVRDRAKLKGYYSKWTDAKYLLGCAVFVDVLTPCATLSKVMQSDDLDVLGAFMSMLRVVKEVDKLGDKSLDEWPTYSVTMKKVKETEGEVAYQHQALKAFAGPAEPVRLLRFWPDQYFKLQQYFFLKKLKRILTETLTCIVIVLRAQWW